MDVPASSGEVLAQATRARIFAWLVEHRVAAGTEELAGALGLHPNGVRRHLELLHEAGLVERRRSRGERGRPGDRWLIAAGARPGGERPSGYSGSGLDGLRAMPAGLGQLRKIESMGREIGRELAPGDARRHGRELPAGDLCALGFQPAPARGRERGRFHLPHRKLPVPGLRTREPCAVFPGPHCGLTAGLLSELDPKARLIRFELHDLDRAGCSICVEGPVCERRPPLPLPSAPTRRRCRPATPAA
ncbi:MAG: helix-turn-helix domain-containing protein [Solirubrobacterales bacterium]